MSVIRQYGNLIINLTKVLSFRRVENKIYFTMPVSNYFNGSFAWMSDSQKEEIIAISEQSAQEEMNNIQNILNEYYKK
jgi:hypothetical protein